MASALGTDMQSGLTAVEAASRLARDGPNELRAAKPRSTWRRALSQLQDPLVALLLVAAAIALLAWWFEGRQGWPMDVMVIAVVVLLNALIGWLQENKAAREGLQNPRTSPLARPRYGGDYLRHEAI